MTKPIIERIENAMALFSGKYNKIVEFTDIDDMNYRFFRLIGIGIDEHDDIFLILRKCDGNQVYVPFHGDDDLNLFFHETDDAFISNYCPKCRPHEGTKMMLWPLFEIDHENIIS